MRRVAERMLTAFAKDQRGSVLVEFAMCLPVMLTLYLGGFVVTDMVTASRKVTIATRALADLASHNLSPTTVQQNPSSASASNYLSASAVVLNPYNLANATQTISLLRVCDANHAYVIWSQTMTQSANGTVLAAPVTVGTPSQASVITLPTNVAPLPVPVNPNGSTGICSNYAASNSQSTQVGQAGAYLFAGHVTYSYTPAVGLGAKTASMMADTIYMSPRLY